MKTRSLLVAAIACVLLFGFPLVVDNSYYIHMVQTIAIYAILLFGLDIVVGYTGQVSLGHAGLFGIGAYTAGVLFTKLAAPLLVSLLGGVVVTAAFGAPPQGGATSSPAKPVPQWPLDQKMHRRRWSTHDE